MQRETEGGRGGEGKETEILSGSAEDGGIQLTFHSDKYEHSGSLFELFMPLDLHQCTESLICSNVGLSLKDFQWLFGFTSVIVVFVKVTSLSSSFSLAFLSI